jgi:hypothetical protein
VVDNLAKEFNEGQKDYKIVPVFKGTYPETLNAGIAAFRAKQPPAIIQVFDAGSGVMMSAQGAIKPAADVLKAGGYTFDKSKYLAGIVAYYSKPDGTMLSFPYNSSSPILYYNKDTIKKAGLDAENPPKPRARSSPAALRLAALPRHGSPGSRRRILPLGTMYPMAAMRMAWAARTSSSPSTHHCSWSIFRQSLISPRKGSSGMAGAHPKPNSCSCPVNAAS